jgi:Flp pilus assembly protein TadD
MRKAPMRIAVLLLLAVAGCASHPPRINYDQGALKWHPPSASKGMSLRVADAALAGGAPEVALVAARDVLARHPGNVGALVREGDALFALQRSEEAAGSYRRALAAEPHDNAARLGLGRVRLRTDPGGAEALLLQVVTAEPGNAAAWNDLGIARDLQGRHQTAQQAYVRAVAAAPEMTAAQVNLGLSLALSGDPGRALDILRPLASGAAASPRVREDLAIALVTAGEDREARQLLRTDLSDVQAADALTAYGQLRPAPTVRSN